MIVSNGQQCKAVEGLLLQALEYGFAERGMCRSCILKWEVVQTVLSIYSHNYYEHYLSHDDVAASFLADCSSTPSSILRSYKDGSAFK